MTNLPNILTFLRLICIPLLVLFFYLPVTWSYLACSLIFAIAGITDWFDGYLARKLNQTSAFGAFLDPVADKLIISVALVLLVEKHPHMYFTLPAAIIIGREITISALREWMAEIGARAKVAVSFVGKVKTSMQLTAIFWLLYGQPLLGLPMVEFGFICLYLAVILTLWSMVIYMKLAIPSILNASK